MSQMLHFDTENLPQMYPSNYMSSHIDSQ